MDMVFFFDTVLMMMLLNLSFLTRHRTCLGFDDLAVLGIDVGGHGIRIGIAFPVGLGAVSIGRIAISSLAIVICLLIVVGVSAGVGAGRSCWFLPRLLEMLFSARCFVLESWSFPPSFLFR